MTSDREKQQRGKVIQIKDLSALFSAYFNNKMTILLMMIEHPVTARSVISIERQRVFLHDLYHHFLPQDASPKCHHAFRWLDRFFNLYPDVGPKRIHKAIEMVGVIYETFGLKLDPRIEAIRIEKETPNLKKRKRSEKE